MPANEFEKQVHQLMEEVRLSPSEGVWPKVEERIREKKRRRGIFILFLFAGLLLLGYLSFSYLFPNNNQELGKASTLENKVNVQENEQTSLPNNSLKSVNKLPVSEKDKSTHLPLAKPDSPASIKINSVTETKKDTRIEKPPVVTPSSNTVNVFGSGMEKNKANSRNVINANGNEETNRVNEQIKNTATSATPALINNDVDIQNKTAIKNNDVVNKTDSNLTVTDSLTTDTLIVATDSKNEIENISKSAALKKHVNGKKLRFGFSFSAGSSAMNDKIFSLDKSSRVADVNASQSTTGTSFGNVYAPPSQSAAGLAFHAGIIIAKTISRRSSVSLTPSYGYYSTHMKIGTRKDSILFIQNSLTASQTLPAYYQATQQYNYTNKFHFLELPVQYNLQINKSKKTPLMVEAGVVLSRLISTNALTYDTARRGVYYSGRDLFNKTQIAISTGLSFGVNTKNGTQLTFGPQARFGLGNIYESEFEKNKHMFYGGFKINLILPGK